MVRKISNVMAKIQVAKNIILFLATSSLKNLTTSLANEEEEKQYKKKLEKIKPTNFHNVPKLIID